jgi:hypothetical protein
VATPYGAPRRPTFTTERPPGPPGSNPPATWSVVLGSIALALLVLSVGLWFAITVPLSVGALVLARAARRRIDAGVVAAGAGAAQAGRVIAIIGIVLGLLAGVVWVILFATGFSLEGLLEDLERQLEQRREGGGTGGGTEV